MSTGPPYPSLIFCEVDQGIRHMPSIMLTTLFTSFCGTGLNGENVPIFHPCLKHRLNDHVDFEWVSLHACIPIFLKSLIFLILPIWYNCLRTNNNSSIGEFDKLYFISFYSLLQMFYLWLVFHFVPFYFFFLVIFIFQEFLR